MEQITLSNGVRILLESIPFFKTASFGIWVLNGSRHEKQEEGGASHFLEHMMFKGTSSRSALDIAIQSDLLGGQLNAYTSKEYTCYYAHTLSDHAPAAFEMLCDMLTDPRMDKEDVELERGVILDEIAMYEDSAEDVAADLLYDGVWPNHPLGRPILGTADTVSSFAAQDLVHYLDGHYTPDRILVSVCGSYDREAMLDICSRYLGSISPKKGQHVEDSPRFTPSVRLRDKDFEQSAILLGFPGLPLEAEDRIALSIFSNIAGGNASSRLFQRLREELGLVYSVSSYCICHKGAGLMAVGLTVTPDLEEKALEETMKVLKSLKQSVTQEELTRAKEQLKAGLVMGMEGISSRAASAARSCLLEGRIYTEDMLIQRVDAVTLDHLMQRADEALHFDQMAVAAAGQLKQPDFYESLRG
nr:pitrilysin family protein [uncultured Solibaculum sp.]